MNCPLTFTPVCNIEQPVNLTCMSLEGNTCRHGENMQNTERSQSARRFEPRPTCNKVTVLTHCVTLNMDSIITDTGSSPTVWIWRPQSWSMMQREDESAREEFSYTHIPTLERASGGGTLSRRLERERDRVERDSYIVDVRASDLELDQAETFHPCFSYRAWLYSILIGVRSVLPITLLFLFSLKG